MLWYPMFGSNIVYSHNQNHNFLLKLTLLLYCTYIIYFCSVYSDESVSVTSPMWPVLPATTTKRDNLAKNCVYLRCFEQIYVAFASYEQIKHTYYTKLFAMIRPSLSQNVGKHMLMAMMSVGCENNCASYLICEVYRSQQLRIRFYRTFFTSRSHYT